MTDHNPPTEFDPHEFHMTFTLAMNEDAAFAAFVQKYGQPPNVIVEHNNQLWVGPIPHPTKNEENES